MLELIAALIPVSDAIRATGGAELVAGALAQALYALEGRLALDLYPPARMLRRSRPRTR